MDDDGKLKGFIGDDDVIVGIPGRGHQYHGAVTLLNEAAMGTIPMLDPTFLTMPAIRWIRN